MGKGTLLLRVNCAALGCNQGWGDHRGKRPHTACFVGLEPAHEAQSFAAVNENYLYSIS
jgi:hypothetical protein